MAGKDDVADFDTGIEPLPLGLDFRSDSMSNDLPRRWYFPSRLRRISRSMPRASRLTNSGLMEKMLRQLNTARTCGSVSSIWRLWPVKTTLLISIRGLSRFHSALISDRTPCRTTCLEGGTSHHGSGGYPDRCRVHRD